MQQATEGVQHAGQGGNGAYQAGGSHVPTDEEILGITIDDTRAASGVILSEAKDLSAAFDELDDGRLQRDSSAVPAGPGLPQNHNQNAAGPGEQAGRSTEGDAADKAAQQPTDAVPEWVKALAADPKIGKDVQALWEQHQAYREVFPTVAEARTLKELFPGGAESAKQLAVKAEQIDRLDDAYFSADPRAQAQLAQNLLQDDPRAFQTMLGHAAQVLAARDPQAYQELAAGLVASALRNERLDRHVALMRAARERGDAAALAQLTDRLVAWSESIGRRAGAQRNTGLNAGSRAGEDPSTEFAPSEAEGLRASAGGTEQSRQDAGGTRELDRAREQVTRQRAEIDQQRQELDHERQHFRAAQYSAFEQSANDVVVSQVRQAIEQTVAAALPAGTAEGARQRIAEDVLGEVNATLQGDRALTRQVAEILRQCNFDEATRQQVVSLIFGRAKSLVPAAAKRVVGEWTATVLGASRQKSEKQQSAAQRVDLVGGGAPEPVGRKALMPRDIDYRRTSDDEILSL